jgi:hypothetical protein
MFVRTVILCLCIAPHSLLLAQIEDSNNSEKDYIKFKGTLDKELIELANDTSRQGTNVLHPVLLPEWFFNLPVSTTNCIYTIGISDPGMEEEEAFKLAELRAKCIATLLLHAEISSVVDNYSNDRQTEKAEEFTTKYVNYFRIRAKDLIDDENFKIVSQHFTSFNEAIIVLKYSVNKLSTGLPDSLTVIIDVYQAERQKYNKFEMEEKYEIAGTLNSSESDETYYYSFQSLNNLFEITSSYNDKKLHFPYFHFRYQGQPQDQPNTLNYSITSKLNYGIWKAFLEVFLQKVFLLSQPHNVKVKKVGDDYTSKNQDFIREVSESKPSFKIINIHISNNQLFVEMDYLNQPK